MASLPSNVCYNHVTLLEQSYERLTYVPRDTSSVGLVCYNLGYLPGAPRDGAPSNDEGRLSQTETKMNSIIDASLLLLVGGLLSVMTYPGSNLEEGRAVEHFAEGLAMLTRRDARGWRGYSAGIPDYDNDEGRGRGLVTRA